MKRERQRPLLVVELAWRDNTSVTRSLAENLTLSRKFAERVFGEAA